MIKVAVIGCGMVADQHVSQIRRVTGCAVVGICDRDPLMANQLAERFNVPQQFSNPAQMLKAVRPNVVHITTPAQTHFALGKLCLEAGCHAYLEKPFTVNACEAEELIDTAERKGLKIMAGHNLQFNPEATRMRELVATGFLGGHPVLLECVQSFSHADPLYGKPVLANRNHWVRKLPGSLPHNYISHGIAKIAEFISSDTPRVSALLYSSPFLKSIGQENLIDEIRAVIYDGKNTTAHFSFSTQIPAAANQICLHGPRASLICDSTNRLLIPIVPSKLKSYLRFFLTPRVYEKAYRRNTYHNIIRFLRKDFHMDYGMKLLIEKFYRALDSSGPLPISYRQILVTARIMDSIFRQIPQMDPQCEK